MKKISTLLVALLCCYLGICNGHIALWTSGNDTPDYVFPYSAQLLPWQDQLALRQHIACPTQEELNRLLEDYLS